MYKIIRQIFPYATPALLGSGRSYLQGTHIYSRTLLPLHDLICEDLIFIIVFSFSWTILFSRNSHSFSSSSSTGRPYLRGTRIHSRPFLPLDDLICEALAFILVLSFNWTILFVNHSHSFSSCYLRGIHIHSRLLPLDDLICEALTLILVLSFPAPDFTDNLGKGVGHLDRLALCDALPRTALLMHFKASLVFH